MSRYIVIRSDSDREIVTVGITNLFEDAKDTMRYDFEKTFWKNIDRPNDASFEEVYSEYENEICCLYENSAWLNGTFHTVFDWKIIDTEADDIPEAKEINILSEPLSMEQLVSLTSEDDPYVQGNVLVETDEIIGSGLEEFLDLLSERLVGNVCLMDINYKPIDVISDGRIVIQVSGDVSEMITCTDEMYEELKTSLFTGGKESLEDFLGIAVSSYEDKATVDHLLDDIASQMPDDIMLKFYRKYVGSVALAA